MDAPYISLYRKYRPQTFEELAGEEHVTRTLANAIKQGRVSHAYLFAGPRGTGKTSTAKILAKAMNCDKGPTPEPDNTCDSCVEISAGNSVDVLEIDAASNRGIDEIRELRDKVHFAPTRGRYKVYIIDEVHMLTTEAFNALLKMLEEPPAHAIFVLATTEPHKVIPTILSRCQRFDFRRIGTSDIIRRLRHIASSEGIEIDEGALILIASHAQGSLRDAISDIDQLVAYTGKTVTMDDVSAALGLVPYEQLAEFADLVADRDAAGVLRMIDGLVDSGQDLREFVHGLLGHFRGLFIIAGTGADDILDLPEEQITRLHNQADRFSLGAIEHAVALLSETYSDMRVSTDPRLALEVVAVKMTRTGVAAKADKETVKAEPKAAARPAAKPEPKAAPEPKPTPAAESRPEAKPEPEPAPAPTAKPRPEPETKPEPETRPEPEPSLEPEIKPDTERGVEMNAAKAKRAWPVITAYVKQKRVPTYSLLLECEPTARDGVMVLLFNSRAAFHKGEVEKPENMKLVVEAAESVFGKGVKIVCELGDHEGHDEMPEDAGPQREEVPPHHVEKVMRDEWGAEMVDEIPHGE